MRAGVEGEDRQNSISLSGSASANRVTERLKVEMSVDGRYDREEFEVDDTTTVTSIERDYELETLVVHSIGAHWSAGGEGTELETGFEYDVSVGFSDTFGSIFNNVVNPRFEGGGGGGRRF